MIIGLKINIVFINNFGEFLGIFELFKNTFHKKQTNPTLNRPTRGPFTNSQTLAPARAARKFQPPPPCSPSLPLFSLPPSLFTPSPLSLPTAESSTPRAQAPASPRARRPAPRAAPLQPEPLCSCTPRRPRASHDSTDRNADSRPARDTETDPTPLSAPQAATSFAPATTPATVSLLRLMDFISSVSSPPLPPSISGETDGIKPCNGVKRRRPMISLATLSLSPPSLYKRDNWAPSHPPYPSSLPFLALSRSSFVAGVCRSSPEPSEFAGARHSPSVVKPLLFSIRSKPVDPSPSHARTQGWRQPNYFVYFIKVLFDLIHELYILFVVIWTRVIRNLCVYALWNCLVDSCDY
jgi:hypothetical protein